MTWPRPWAAARRREVGRRPGRDIVITALLYGAVVPVVAEYGDALAGKVIVDISNPFNATFDGLAHSEETSIAQEVAKVAPASASVVKAFNTIFRGVLEKGRPDVFIAGDDAQAKASVEALIKSIGLRPLDVGGLKMAHWLEGMGVVTVGLAGNGVGHWDFALGVNEFPAEPAPVDAVGERRAVRLTIRRTAWVRALARPARAFIATEVGSAFVLLAAVLVALVWANSPWGSTYEDVWSTELSIRLGDAEISEDLRGWVNDGLMTFFFFVIGLEIRREFDMGEFRDRRRLAVPVVAAIGGMVAPALIYLAINAGTDAAHGWGVAMPTDTAFALGVLALVGRRFPLRLHVFLLTLAVVDDVGALLVIAVAYTEDLTVTPLLLAVGVFGVVVAFRAAGVKLGAVYFVLGVVLWLALFEAGVHPTIAGVAMGLLATAYPPSRTALEQASSLWRSFREQPTSGYARSAGRGLRRAISPNERLQEIYHPWTSYVIVPLFALANAGVELTGDILAQAASSPITIGIVVGLVVGKLVGISAASWLATRRRLGGFPVTVPWLPLVGTASVAGIGFTVSLFIAEIAFDGAELDEAKVGILAASVIATLLSWLVFRVIDLLPERIRSAGQATQAEPLIDLVDPVEDDVDHVRGLATAPVTLVEYGDFECPYCGRAEPVIRSLLSEFGADLRFVFRNLPLDDVHENARLAAEAAECAGAFGRYWEMHDLLFQHQDALATEDLIDYARQLGLDVDVFATKLRKRKYSPRVERDIDSADRSGVSGTPTFFVNGRRHQGAYDLETLTALVRSALTQSTTTPSPSTPTGHPPE